VAVVSFQHPLEDLLHLLEGEEADTVWWPEEYKVEQLLSHTANAGCECMLDAAVAKCKVVETVRQNDLCVC
jgi:hypothetical protein